MLKILAIDPSGTGKTGICLIDGKKITFQEIKSKVWSEHLSRIVILTEAHRATVLLYENTNYINSKGRDMTSLFKLMGAIEGLKRVFTFVERIESILVNQVKDLKKQLFKGTKQIPHLTYQVGKGWFYQAKKLSLHELDAFLVYWRWKEKNG